MAMKRAIVVVGSSNTDMVIAADRLPAPGETILGGTFFMNAGGKGANQAVAAARLGGEVCFIAKTGNDIFGRQAVQLFGDEGIDTSYIVSDPDEPSGVALITVDKQGENCIVVASGANATLSPQDLRTAEEVVGSAGCILLQLEIPLATVEYVAGLAAASGGRVILNPAPVCPLPDALLRNVWLLTPNKKEAEMLTGIEIRDLGSAREAAECLRQRGVKSVIITLGAEGAALLYDQGFVHVPAIPVKAVDTTAAGDVFNGALAAALSEGLPLLEATKYACRAAAVSVTRRGAQVSAPRKHELAMF